MQVGLIGLGRMGTNLALQAMEKGHRVVGFDANPQAVSALSQAGLLPARSIEELIALLDPPRCVLLYVPHGPPTETVVAEALLGLEVGDVLADGGNSHWQQSRVRHGRAVAKGIGFLDVGTSGGLAGARRGACFMVGGKADVFAQIEPLLRDLAVADGVLHVGPAGAGHFVKLIHNAIEFGMLQALGEGLDLLVRSDYPLQLPALFELWSHGSVIRGWLVELLADGLRKHQLDTLSPYVEDTREVRWAIEYALEKEACVPVITQAELALYGYRDLHGTAAKGVALMRYGFGGHPLYRQLP